MAAFSCACLNRTRTKAESESEPQPKPGTPTPNRDARPPPPDPFAVDSQPFATAAATAAPAQCTSHAAESTCCPNFAVSSDPPGCPRPAHGILPYVAPPPQPDLSDTLKALEEAREREVAAQMQAPAHIEPVYHRAGEAPQAPLKNMRYRGFNTMPAQARPVRQKRGGLLDGARIRHRPGLRSRADGLR